MIAGLPIRGLFILRARTAWHSSSDPGAVLARTIRQQRDKKTEDDKHPDLLFVGEAHDTRDRKRRKEELATSAFRLKCHSPLIQPNSTLRSVVADVVDQRSNGYAGRAFRHVRFAFVLPRGAGDVQVYPRRVVGEFAQKMGRGDRAGVAAG